ncbi:centrosomal protein of 162 kDa [Solea solea]|uniref:centrosomal protein of 162 kDa n=1 Tax=Solea solea TaxID=90069 RepID=UPI00272A6858|nr:centrosomal protein of 162 kDa [Solea solea]XP_058502715.1 centrosomal protein of 162 kDa [Solea solea]
MSHRLSKEELDAQFELFLKECVSDESVDLGNCEKQPTVKGSQKPASNPAVSWWQDDNHGDEETGREMPKSRFIKAREPQPENEGLLGSRKSLRTSLGRSQSIQEEQEDSVDSGLRKEDLESFFLSRDNTDAEDSVNVPPVNMVNMGLDTLEEEEEEKAGFFAQLEAGASSTIDYSKLNKEMDSTSSTFGPNLRKADEAVEQNDDGLRKARVTETTSPGSPHYSEDFEDEEHEKEPHEQENPKMSSIIAKVSLFDSLDDTGGDDRRKDTAGSLDKGNSYVKSGGSEMDALHEAYRQIHVVEDSDDYKHSQRSSSLEGRGMLHRSVSPSSPPQLARQSLLPASTNESELPTAEELMKPIRIEEHVRGFTLQPVSGVEPDQEKTLHSLEHSFPDVTYAESQHKEVGMADVKIKGAKELTTRPLSPPDQPNELIWSIREEVERLMEDHNKTFSFNSPQAGKVKKQPAPRSSTTTHPSTSSVRKPTVAPVRGKEVGRRTAVTSSSSGISRVAVSAKTSSLQHPRRAKPTKSLEKDDSTEPSVKVSSELVSSVHSLVTVLQQRMDTTSPQETRETHHPPKFRRDEDSSVEDELRVQLAQRERELQEMKEAAEELHSLRQQNYVLQSKLRSAEEASQRKRLAEATDSATEATLRQMESEMKEQETLIKGYQQENEKLYVQMKGLQAMTKANEEAMFNENSRLLSELSIMREQMSKTSRPAENVCLMDHARRITDLLAEIKTFQRNEAKLSEDIHRLRQEKQALDTDLQLLKKERDLAKVQVMSTSADKTSEIHVLEDKHREEVLALKKKLQWFAENQELLDRDATRLKTAAAEIEQLKQQVEKLKMEVGKRSSEHQRKAREKSVDVKKMQDLQRQVKELEQILRHRNPNSLPALMYAAASAGHEEDGAADKTTRNKKVTALLEDRIQHLEAELENHDEEAKRSLRAMEQQFHSVKLRYEQQISELEQKLQQKTIEVSSSVAEGQPCISGVQTLETELQQVKESHEMKEKSLNEQIKSLQQQIKSRAHQSPGRHQRQAEEAFGVRIERLNQELASKTRTIQDLNRTVERLQRERRSMLSVPNPRAETQVTQTKRQPGPTKTPVSVTATQTCGVEETFPAAQYEKTYQPTEYEGSHVSEVLQENTALTQRLEVLEQRWEKEREALKADAAQAREELHRHQEQSAEQLSSLKAEHLRVLDQLRATHALEHSSSVVAEQANKINTQEIQLKHLREQLKELQGTKDALAVSRTRENVLQKQLTKLLMELKEAKDAQSPEVKLLCNLEKKIVNLELRHQHRETELKQIIGGSWTGMEASHQSEVEHWKNLAQEKSREIEVFRVELDSILDIIKHLQRQGVVFPAPGQLTSLTAPTRSYS